MTLVVKKEVAKGIFTDIPEGTHNVSFPLNKLAFYDHSDNIFGGNFTADNEQLITEGTCIDGVTFSNIRITQES